MLDSSRKLLIATTNPGKVKELASLLSVCPIPVVSLAEAGIEAVIRETGATFEENATLKATAYSQMSGMVTLADDSGLEVEALGGEPGVLSARYAGDGATDAQRIAFLLQKLKNVPEWKWHARFRSVVAIAWPDGSTEVHRGECCGRIVGTPRGENGFGYDPVFLLLGLGKTMAELSPEEKNRISHRGIAVRKAAAALKRWASKPEPVGTRGA